MPLYKKVASSIHDSLSLLSGSTNVSEDEADSDHEQLHSYEDSIKDNESNTKSANSYNEENPSLKDSDRIVEKDGPNQTNKSDTKSKGDQEINQHNEHRTSEDEDVDVARPFGDSDGANFFSTLMNSSSICSGFGTMGNIKNFNFEDLLKSKKFKDEPEESPKHNHGHHHLPRPHLHTHKDKDNEGNSPNVPRPESPNSINLPSPRTGHHRNISQSLNSVGSSEDEDDDDITEKESSDEEEEYDANRLSTTTTSESQAATSSTTTKPTTVPTKTSTNTSMLATSSVSSYSTIDANEEESFVNSEKNGPPLSIEKSTIEIENSEPPEEYKEKLKHLTPLQKSVIDNLDPQHIKEGVLIKIKDKNQDSNDGKLTLSKKILRYKIAEKLKNVFDLDNDDIFYGNYSSWLVKDVLLQGHMYVTKKALLYFAFLPKRFSVNESLENQNIDDSANIVHKGTLGMKTAKFGDSTFTTMLTHRYWAILRPETLSIYGSSTDLYFPLTVIDIRTCQYAEIMDEDKLKEASFSPTNRTQPPSRSGYASGVTTPPAVIDTAYELNKMLQDENIGATEDTIEAKSNSVWFKLVTRKKTYKFQCDNLYSARQWCNNLTKLIFQLNNANQGNEVLVKIPIANIIDFKKRTLFSEEDDDDIDQSENDIPLSLSIKYYTTQHVEKRKREKFKDKFKAENYDKGEIFFLFPKNGLDFFKSFEDIVNNRSKNPSKSKLSLSRDPPLEQTFSTLTLSTNKLVKDVLASNLIDQKAPPDSSTLKKLGKSFTNPRNFLKSSNNNEDEPNDTTSMSDEINSTHISLPKALSEKTLRSLEISFETTFKNLKDASIRYEEEGNNKMLAAINELPLPSNLSDKGVVQNKSRIGKSIKALTNMGQRLAATPNHYTIKDEYYVESEEERDTALRHFKGHFSLYNSKLIASYFCHLVRSLPVYGKLYVSEHEVCFRSMLPGVSTKMIVPMADIKTVEEATNGSKLSYVGAKIILNGAEEMSIEFASTKSRDDFVQISLDILDKLHVNESFRPQPHEWGSNYDIELSKTRMEYTDSERKRIQSEDKSEESKEVAIEKVELARIKMFEDRLTLASGLDIPIILEDSPFFKTEMKPSTSYRITLLTIGSRGDVQPYIALGLGLQKEGHKVTIATHSEFKDWIEKYHFTFKEIAGDPSELMSFMVGNNSMSVSFLKNAQAKFKDWIGKLLTTSWQACQGSDIIIESPSAMAGIHIAEALVIPYYRAFTMPWTRTRAYPHAFFVPDAKKGGSYNYLTHVLFENIFWKGIQSQVNKWRVNELDLPKTNLSRMQQTKVPFLYNVSPCIMPPANDFPDWVKVTGYWFLDEGGDEYKPPKELVEFMNSAARDNKKLVYIGFGSIVVNDATSLTKAIVEAVLEADVRCILNKGWSDRGKSKDKNEIEVELPDEIYKSGAVPHDWLFPRVDAAVHHGGSGTTGATLKAGTPSIIKPFFGDQFFYATRVEELGVGLALKKLTKKSLSEALITVTEDLKIVEKAKQVSEQISHEHGVLSAIEAIYSDLEYARSLIMTKELHNINYKRHHPDFRNHSEATTANVSEDESEDFTDDDDDDDSDEYDDSETEEEGEDGDFTDEEANDTVEQKK
ncbi:ATG26 [Candida pseudojiufengensis]|uniref:ATG26 n=1 Tax=Candida pseudojiufengensis TaxID=497109 RepID=UPI00222590DB|nr:ATG26 [Candida pseudojiufengensis]KAI5966737.1 ATG26 [Candida pseudojiufengensis]